MLLSENYFLSKSLISPSKTSFAGVGGAALGSFFKTDLIIIKQINAIIIKFWKAG